MHATHATLPTPQLMPAPKLAIEPAIVTWDGPSAEMRRFSAGIRVITAMLCTLLLFNSESQLSAAASGVLLCYDLWAAYVLWSEASGHPGQRARYHFWVDVVWTAALLHLTASASSLMILTLVQPVVLTSIGYGVRPGLALAFFAALAILLDFHAPLLDGLSYNRTHALPALGVLGLAPAAALLSRPMSVLRQRLALMVEIEAALDPRRGLESVASSLVDLLRSGTTAHVAAVVLPSQAGAPAVLSSAEDGSFCAGEAVHRQLEALLAQMPASPVTHVQRGRLPRLAPTRIHGPGVLAAALPKQLDALAALLEVRTLVVVPLTRYQRAYGHLLLGRREAGNRTQDAAALAHAAPELLRIIETATLVDRLHDESTAHERSRIGRDLHDSAIQPYLGLKYAVEGVAMRMAPGNPAYGEVQSLLDLVSSEIVELREVISGLRVGEPRGDNALVPAVRRQVKRFALLFGIEVHLESPDQLTITRARAGALFHMVNEALNNVRRHTPARQVWVTISVTPDDIRLIVRDDGGTENGAPMPDFRPGSLSERSTALGGTLVCERPDGLNTQITISVPH